MAFLTLDFSQSYPLIAAGLFILSAIHLNFYEGKMYRRKGWNREALWSRRGAWINLVLGCMLLVAQWMHHQLWWL